VHLPLCHSLDGEGTEGWSLRLCRTSTFSLINRLGKWKIATYFSSSFCHSFGRMLLGAGMSIGIENNAQLEDITALARLTVVQGDLFINSNPKLLDMRALAALQSVRLNLIISNNAALSSLDGLGEGPP
jgi:hypothetical protein